MRIATWNLWWKFGPWTERQQPIIAEARSVDPDVLCLQEVWSDGDDDQADLIARELGHHVARSRRVDGAPHAFGNAILSRFPILESFTQVLPDGKGEPSHRSAVHAKIDLPGTSGWWVVSTHLEWRYDASDLRQRQLDAICQRIGETQSSEAESDGGTPAPVVLAGDCNAEPASDEIRRLTGLAVPYRPRLVFTDCWAAVRDDPGHTWTRGNPHSVNAQWPRRRLDYVFVSWPRPKPTGNPLEAELFGVGARRGNDGEPCGVGDPAGFVPSDHYGVVVELDRRTPADLT